MSFGKALAIEKELVRGDPGNRRYEEDLARTYRDMSAVYGVARDRGSTLETARQALAMTESLAARCAKSRTTTMRSRPGS